MRWLAASLVILSLSAVACGKGARNDASATASASVSASASVPAPAVSSSAAMPPPAPRPPVPPFVAANVPSLQPPSAPACVLQTSDGVGYRGGLPLRVDPAGAAFLRVSEESGRRFGDHSSRVSGGLVRLSWPAESGAPVATLTRGAFSLQAFAPADTKVSAARAMTLAGVLSVSNAASFTLVGTENGMVVPTIAEGSLRMRKPLEPRPCNDFTLGFSKLDGHAEVPEPKVPQRRLLRTDNVPVPVAATADGEPVLDISSANQNVTVLDERDGRTRIIVPRFVGQVVGWVASTVLRPADGKQEGMGLEDFPPFGPGAVPDPGPALPPPDTYECDSDVPLYVDMTDSSPEDLLRLPYARVGTIQKKRTFDVRPGRGGLDRVGGQKLSDLTFTEPGLLSVASEDLEKVCRRIRRARK